MNHRTFIMGSSSIRGKHVVGGYSYLSYRLLCNKSHRFFLSDLCSCTLCVQPAASRLPSVTMAIPSPVPGKVHFWTHRDFYIRTFKPKLVCMPLQRISLTFFSHCLCMIRIWVDYLLLFCKQQPWKQNPRSVLMHSYSNALLWVLLERTTRRDNNNPNKRT